jgi:hypothetical protein
MLLNLEEKKYYCDHFENKFGSFSTQLASNYIELYNFIQFFVSSFTEFKPFVKSIYL